MRALVAGGPADQASALGADEVITDVVAAPRRMDVVLESVGGRWLTAALDVLAADACRASWSEAGTVIAELLERRFDGKAVLRVR